MMHFPISYNKPIVGRNAFQHEAGIHQDGLLKNRSTYEIMDPEQMGIPRSMIILGKHSGRHALKHRVRQAGVTLDDRRMEELYVKFKDLADAEKVVTDDQLLQLIGKTINQAVERYRLIDLQVTSHQDQGNAATAAVRDQLKGVEYFCSGSGEGPVAAAIQCIKQAISVDVGFEDLELHSMAAGEKAYGEAAVTVSYGGQFSRGTAVDRDIIIASAKAFMTAVNQAVRTLPDDTSFSSHGVS